MGKAFSKFKEHPKRGFVLLTQQAFKKERSLI